MDVLDRLWNKGQAVFEKWADLEIRELELEIQKDLTVQQLQLQALQAPATTGFLPGQTQSGLGGVSMGTLLLIAAVGVGGYFLVKKL